MNTKNQGKRKNNSLYLVPQPNEIGLRGKGNLKKTDRQQAVSYCGIEEIGFTDQEIPRLWQDRNKLSQVLENCQEALTMNPNSKEADHLWDSIVEQKTKLLESQTSTRFPPQNLSPEERLGSAINRYRYQAQLYPDSAIVQTNLGRLYHKNHQWQEAVRCYKRAITIDSHYSPAHQYLAQIANENGVSSGSEAQELQQQVDFYFKLAHTQIQEGRIREAQICYQQIIKSDPNNWQAHHRLGNLLAYHRQWERALDSYQKAIQFQDTFASAYHNAGNVCLALERWRQAIDYYQSAIELNPYFYLSYYNLGEARSKIQQWEQALSAYEEAGKLQPEINLIREKINKVVNHLAFSI